MNSLSMTWSTGVLIWWCSLCAISVLNLVLWFRSFKKPLEGTGRCLQVWLSLIFVVVCGFRSVFPRADVQRIVLFDTWISSVAVGRSVATLAELSLMAQLSIYVRELAKATHQKTALRISWVILPLITIAETCSWYAVITTNYMGNFCEESIWTLSSFLLVIGYWLTRNRVDQKTKSTLTYGLLIGIGYLIFMTTVDLPMYFTRWQADQSAHRVYFTLAEGLRDVSRHWVWTRSFEDWKTEMPWMGLYFSAAVWLSISLIHAPKAQDSGDRKK
jgi:hypothetical protein